MVLGFVMAVDLFHALPVIGIASEIGCQYSAWAMLLSSDSVYYNIVGFNNKLGQIVEVYVIVSWVYGTEVLCLFCSPDDVTFILWLIIILPYCAKSKGHRILGVEEPWNKWWWSGTFSFTGQFFQWNIFVSIDSCQGSWDNPFGALSAR